MTTLFIDGPPISKSRRPILVIDPALHTCELDCFNEILRRAPHDVDFRYFAPARFGTDDLTNNQETPSGIIMLGSGASVYDDSPWQRVVHPWIHEHMLNGVPALGLCYGHQLFAHLFGGRIALGFGGSKKRGCRKIDIRQDCRLADASMVISTIVSHREVVVDPGQFEVIASSEDVTIEGIQHPSLPIWGFQPHIEATAAFLRNNDILVEKSAHDPVGGYRLIDKFVQLTRSTLCSE